jgi:hypothetical protein
VMAHLFKNLRDRHASLAEKGEKHFRRRFAQVRLSGVRWVPDDVDPVICEHCHFPFAKCW